MESDSHLKAGTMLLWLGFTVGMLLAAPGSAAESAASVARVAVSNAPPKSTAGTNAAVASGISTNRPATPAAAKPLATSAPSPSSTKTNSAVRLAPVTNTIVSRAPATNAAPPKPATTNAIATKPAPAAAPLVTNGPAASRIPATSALARAPVTNAPAPRASPPPPPLPPKPIPPAERLLPADTVMMVTVPDFARFRVLHGQTPQSRLWRDPAMKAFAAKFDEQMQNQLIAPLERELNLRWSDISAWPQGQFTAALVPTGPPGNESSATALLVLLDARGQAEAVTRNLATLKKKWVDAGRTLRSEKIRDRDFTVLLASASEVPSSVMGVLAPPRTFIDPTGANRPPTPVEPSADVLRAAAVKREYFVGQVDSLLIAGTAARPIERLLARLAGAQLPALEDAPSFAAKREALFRGAAVCGWINPRPFTEALAGQLGDRPNPPLFTNGPPENVFFLTFGTARLLSAMGFGSLKHLAFGMHETSHGSLLQLSASVPPAERKGLFKILAGESTQSGPPLAVPASALGFWRWRVNGPKTWDVLLEALADLDPQLANTFNWLLDSANEAARVSDPQYDLRKALLASLGDDILGYQVAAPAGSGAGASPSLYVLSSPKPQQLDAALHALFVLLPQLEGNAAERTFLGTKIHAVILPTLPGSEPPRGGPRVLHYAADNRGVVMSTDAAVLEGYLRGSDPRFAPLRATPGFAEAAESVIGSGASWFAYENQTEVLRTTFEAARKDPNSASDLSALLPFPASLDLFKDLISFQQWMDPSLLPPYERVAKYFAFNLWAVSATSDGVSMKYFAPTPPELRRQP